MRNNGQQSHDKNFDSRVSQNNWFRYTLIKVVKSFSFNSLIKLQYQFHRNTFDHISLKKGEKEAECTFVVVFLFDFSSFHLIYFAVWFYSRLKEHPKNSQKVNRHSELGVFQTFLIEMLKRSRCFHFDILPTVNRKLILNLSNIRIECDDFGFQLPSISHLRGFVIKQCFIFDFSLFPCKMGASQVNVQFFFFFCEINLCFSFVAIFFLLLFSCYLRFSRRCTSKLVSLQFDDGNGEWKKRLFVSELGWISNSVMVKFSYVPFALFVVRFFFPLYCVVVSLVHFIIYEIHTTAKHLVW